MSKHNTAMVAQGEVLGLFAETPIHAGAGQSEGAVDLPIAREATTDLPVVPGSGVKGALKDRARDSGVGKDQMYKLFGASDNAGQLILSDARLLLLPIRTLNGPYRWLCCPYLIERYQRDCLRLGPKSVQPNSFQTQGLQEAINNADRDDGLPEALVANEEGKIFFEDQIFVTRESPVIRELVAAIAPLLGHETSRKRLEKQLVVVSDADFAVFSKYALPVVARNALEKHSKRSKNLWYEEQIPADSLFYVLLSHRSGYQADDEFDALFEPPYMQLGGKETVGQGWFRVARLPGEGAG